MDVQALAARQRHGIAILRRLPAAKESRLKATAEELPDYVERVPRRFEADRRGDESFAAWTLRATEEELS